MCIHVYLRVYVYVSIFVCIGVCTCVYVYTPVRLCTHVCVHMYVSVCTFMVYDKIQCLGNDYWVEVEDRCTEEAGVESNQLRVSGRF